MLVPFAVEVQSCARSLHYIISETNKRVEAASQLIRQNKIFSFISKALGALLLLFTIAFAFVALPYPFIRAWSDVSGFNAGLAILLLAGVIAALFFLYCLADYLLQGCSLPSGWRWNLWRISFGVMLGIGFILFFIK
jgi:hypothetical protein